MERAKEWLNEILLEFYKNPSIRLRYKMYKK